MPKYIPDKPHPIDAAALGIRQISAYMIPAVGRGRWWNAEKDVAMP